MQGYNVIVVYNQAADRLLMCRRKKSPYKGLSNFVGGKIEPGEDGVAAAYRELREETSITHNDIILTRLMDFTYYLDDCHLEVYVGQLNKELTAAGDENDLYWSETDCNFFDCARYAGEGSVGHILAHVKRWSEQLLLK